MELIKTVALEEWDPSSIHPECVDIFETALHPRRLPHLCDGEEGIFGGWHTADVTYEEVSRLTGGRACNDREIPDAVDGGDDSVGVAYRLIGRPNVDQVLLPIMGVPRGAAVDSDKEAPQTREESIGRAVSPSNG